MKLGKVAIPNTEASNLWSVTFTKGSRYTIDP